MRLPLECSSGLAAFQHVSALLASQASCRCGWTMASVPLVSQSHGSLAAAHAAVALVSPATSKRFASQDDHKHKHRHQHKLAHGNMCDNFKQCIFCCCTWCCGLCQFWTQQQCSITYISTAATYRFLMALCVLCKAVNVCCCTVCISPAMM